MHNALLRIEIDVVSHPRTSASSGKKQNLVLEIAENRGKIAFAIVFASRTHTGAPRRGFIPCSEDLSPIVIVRIPSI